MFRNQGAHLLLVPALRLTSMMASKLAVHSSSSSTISLRLGGLAGGGGIAPSVASWEPPAAATASARSPGLLEDEGCGPPAAGASSLRSPGWLPVAMAPPRASWRSRPSRDSKVRGAGDGDPLQMLNAGLIKR